MISRGERNSEKHSPAAVGIHTTALTKRERYVFRPKKKLREFSRCYLNRGCVNYSANRSQRKLAIYLAGCAIADRFLFSMS